MIASLTSCGPVGVPQAQLSPTIAKPTSLTVSVTATAAPQRSPTSTFEPTATIESQPTVTNTPIPFTSTATNNPDLPPADILQFRPLEITVNLPADASPPDVLILSGDGYSLLNFRTGTEEEFPDDQRCLFTSPNGQWLAYCQRPEGVFEVDHWIIESADGQEMYELPLDEDWIPAGMWLDNQHLVFNKWVEPENEPTSIRPVVVVNPFTGEQQELASDYPDLKGNPSGPAGTLHFVYSTVVYHPSLDLVIYPKTTDSDYVVLWDRKNQQELASLKDTGAFLMVPKWSPDGEQFVVNIPQYSNPEAGDFISEWFSVSKEGQVQQLTHFGDFFTSARTGREPSWSPDGRYIAFLLSTVPDMCGEGGHLAILELETQQVTNYCVPVSVLAPNWSLDSRYLIVQSSQPNNYQVILVDIQEGWAAQIAESAEVVTPVGWLLSP